MKRRSWMPISTQGGFTITESLVGMVVVMTGVVAVISLIAYMGKAMFKNKAVMAGLSVESYIISASQDKDFLKNTISSDGRSLIQAMEAGVPNIKFDLKNTSGVMIAKGGEPVYLDSEGQPCVGYPSASCTIATEVSLKNLGSAADPNYQFAYAVEFSNKSPSLVSARSLGKATAAKNGSDGKGSRFTDADYSLPVNLQSAVENTALEQCNAASGDVIVSGLDRVEGSVSCLKTPQNRIPQGVLPIDVKADPATRELKLVTIDTSKLRCPTNYAVRNFNPSKVLAGTVHKCLFIGADSVPFRGVSSRRHGVSSYPCPPNYEVDPASLSCSGVASVVSNPNCACGYNTGSNTKIPCATFTGLGTGFTLKSDVGDLNTRASCTAHYKPQRVCLNGSRGQIDVMVSMSGSCKLKAGVPREVDAVWVK